MENEGVAPDPFIPLRLKGIIARRGSPRVGINEEGTMKTRISTAILAAMLMGGTVVSLPPVAAAQDVQFEIGRHRPPPPDYQQDDEDAPQPEYGYHRPRPDYDRPSPRDYGRRGCDPRQAVAMASRNGLRHAHVVDVSPRRITVDGFTRRGPDEMVFGNVRGCPSLD